MKVGIIGATGKAGQMIMDEAVKRGFEVTAIVRDQKKIVNPAVQVIEKNIFDLSAEDLAAFDVVVDAFGAWEDRVKEHVTSLAHLTTALKGLETRLIVVGGAGSLYMDPGHSLELRQTPDFPKDFLPLVDAMAEGLAELRKVKDVHWVYVSPAADFQANGARTGTYALAGERFETNVAGKSEISYADFALAINDEIENAKHDQQRISVHSK